MNSRRFALLALPLLCMLQACPPTDPGPEVQPAPPPPPTEKPITEAIEITLNGPEMRFCCDPSKPFPQVVGTITVTNTNTDSQTDAINVFINLDAGRTDNVDTRPSLAVLRSGQSQTFEVVANTCDFESESMLIETGYASAGIEHTQNLTVNNACPGGSATAQTLLALYGASQILPLFHESFVLAAIGAVVQHSSVNVPPALIAWLFAEITGYGAFGVSLTAAQVAAAFSATNDNPTFPEGQGPEGFTIHPDISTPMSAGGFVVVYQVVDEPIPLADPQRHFQYGFVFDSDGNTFNNYTPPAAFDNDFFRDTDRWYAVTYSPQAGWSLAVTDATNGNLTAVASAARVIIRDNTMLLVVPVTEFAVPNPAYRVTSFAHNGDWGLNPPHTWSGDPTPTVHEPLATFQ